MTLYLIGLGLGSKKHLTLEALDLMERADKLILDTYTSIIGDDLVKYLEERFGEKLIEAERSMLEDDVEKVIEEAEEKDLAILVPGDPLIATTHISIIIEAIKKGVRYKLVHGLSIVCAAISASCLQAYKFGKTITIPKRGYGVETCYRVIAENLEKGLHTLILLDTAEGGLRIIDALRILLDAEERIGKGIISLEGLVICLARIGFGDELRFAGRISEALSRSYPPPPHALIIPGELHFAEIEALKEVLGADEEALRAYKPRRFERERIKSYIFKVDEVMRRLEIKKDEKTSEAIRIAESYLEDAKRFLEHGDLFDSLAAISYAEGILDGLRFLGEIYFEWPKT